MVQLFEQDIKTNERQSSKGNQLKWCRNNVWYKADYMGYEGLVEYVVSRLLEKSSLKQEEYVLYKTEEIIIREENIWDEKVKIFCLRDGNLLH